MDDIQDTSGVNQEAAAPQEHADSVPVHVVQAIRSENQQLKASLRAFQDHLDLEKANRMREQQQQSLAPQPDDQEVVTIGDLKKYAGQMQRQHQMEVEELKMSMAHKDYSDVISTYLPKVLQENPDLKDEIARAKNPYKMAYYLAKKSDAYQETQQQGKVKERHADAQKIIDNSKKTGSLSAVGSSSPISTARDWKNMPDSEFRKIMNRNMGM